MSQTDINYKKCWEEFLTNVKESATDHDPDPTWTELLEEMWEIEDRHKRRRIKQQPLRQDDKRE